jgi:hypothetical protein
VSRKPALPSRPAPSTAHTAPDALVISAQLAPWLFMRASVEGAVEHLELETEVKRSFISNFPRFLTEPTLQNLISQEKKSLFEIEKDIAVQRRRLEISGQVEVLSDLCHPQVREHRESFHVTFELTLVGQNKAFSSQISGISSFLSIFLSSTQGMSQLDTLRDLVHSHEWNPECFDSLKDEIGIYIISPSVLISTDSS